MVNITSYDNLISNLFGKLKLHAIKTDTKKVYYIKKEKF